MNKPKTTLQGPETPTNEGPTRGYSRRPARPAEPCLAVTYAVQFSEWSSDLPSRCPAILTAFVLEEHTAPGLSRAVDQ